MLQRMRNKLKRNDGASLGEVLVTVLIMSLVTGAIASGVLVVQRVYKGIRLKADAQTLLSTVALAVSEDLHYASEVETDDNDVVTSFYAEKRGYEMVYQNVTGDYAGIVRSNLDEGTTIPVVTDKTQTLGLYARLKDNQMTCDQSGLFVYTIEICSSDKNAASDSDDIIESQVVKVRSTIS